ncbi:FliA/WhiG family RNA polymerase sigma factor [Fretibacterium sp. OH1220_COT-178]|uniref:FliA/WhiG family RNA polymerase sigma factor n=1 Tax=Fretibacterium sp. OH1220_COT-178 TaxID=2491047 RepID=UPI000F5F12D3|nr:FliA/WhiG family RNA polymerase sigma factor [Fretibacterium sp. OH1220_COT-178]RRD63483.1 FliA/WhiG family RNA polymerase sigma factor [Fretibacterium sp. OH1220_COT-178]
MSLEASDAELWEEYARSPTPACRERIVKRYLPLIKYVVGRMTVTPPPGLDYEDLWSFGIFGLLDAIERFDLSKGFSFRTFAVPRIRGAVLDELRKCDWVSRTGREKLQRLNRASEKVLRDRGRLRDDWVMEEMGVDEKAYREVLELSSRSYVASLDEVMELEDGEVSLEGILSDGREGAVELLDREDELKRVVDAMKQLPEREVQVLSLYYYEGLALKEIGRVLGVTESRVSQIHGRALSALRAILRVNVG